MRSFLLVVSIVIAACGFDNRIVPASAMDSTQEALLIVKFKTGTPNDAMVRSLVPLGTREARARQPAADRLAGELSAGTGAKLRFYDVVSGGELLLAAPPGAPAHELIERLAKTRQDIDYAEPAGRVTPQAR